MPQDVQQRIDKIVELYLSDDRLNAAVTDEFLDWFADCGHVEQKYRAFETMFDRQVGFDMHPSRETRRDFERLSRRLGLKISRPVRGFRWFAVRAAAAFVPLAIVAAALWSYFNGRSEETAKQTDAAAFACNSVVLAAPQNEMLIHQRLPDCSKISINEGSTLRYAANFEKSRVVTLSGESYFKVKQREGEPFVVKTQNMEITVNGTSFNVDSYPDSLRDVVSLYKGALYVEVDSQAYNLTAGERLIYDRVNDRVTIQSIIGKEKPCWIQRVLACNRTIPADGIVKELAESCQLQIICPDSTMLDGALTLRTNTPQYEGISFISAMGGKAADCHTDKHELMVNETTDNT